MVESAEGIGGRKWSLLKDDDGRFVVMQGTKRIAIVEDPSIVHLLVTAPQLWDAANDVSKEVDGVGESCLLECGLTTNLVVRLANMVAKSVNKTEYRAVLQATE